MVGAHNTITIRDVEQIVSRIALVHSDVLEKEHLCWIMVMNDLIILKSVRPDLYDRFLNSMVTPADLREYYGIEAEELEQSLRDPSRVNYELRTCCRNWLFISRDPSTDELAEKYKSELARELKNTKTRNSLDNLPIWINSRWIDQFKIYGS